MPFLFEGGSGVLLFGLMITMMKMRGSIAGLGLCV